MNTLTEKELYEIKGGGIHWGIVFAVAGAISFFAGLVDGLIRLK